MRRQECIFTMARGRDAQAEAVLFLLRNLPVTTMVWLRIGANGYAAHRGGGRGLQQRLFGFVADRLLSVDH
jgi:hypothetical protein